MVITRFVSIVCSTRGQLTISQSKYTVLPGAPVCVVVVRPTHYDYAAI
jgi:hypothetical protein